MQISELHVLHVRPIHAHRRKLVKKEKSFNMDILPWFCQTDGYFCPPSLQLSRVFSVVNLLVRCLGPPAPLWSLSSGVLKINRNMFKDV